MASHLLAGVARSDITPPPGIAHAGWGAQAHQRAAGVDLPLWLTALAISDGEQTVVVIDIDTMYLFEEEAAAVQRAVADLTRLPPGNIRLSYTHTHSGPLTGKAWSAWMQEGPEMIPSYDGSLQHAAAGAAWAAMNALEPVRVGANRGEVHIGVNRRFQRPEDGVVVVGRNWAGPVDPEVLVVRLDTMEGDPLATIVNYACHPITVGPDHDRVTPDYPGVTKRVVEEATGSTCLFLQGAAGDIGPSRGVARGGAGEYQRLGAILGHEASRLWWEMELPSRAEAYRGTLESGSPLAIYDDVPCEEPARRLRVCSRTAALPTRDIGDPDAYEETFRRSVGQLNRLRAQGASAEAIREQTMHTKRSGMRAGLARRIAESPGWEVSVQGIALGDDIVFQAIAAEPFVLIGRQIKERSPFAYTLFSGYSNVGWAYLPTADAYPLGGYEVEISPFAPEAAELLVESCLDMLHVLSEPEESG